MNASTDDVLPRPADSCQPDVSADGGSLKRELLEELRASWEAGRPVAPEELLNRWPPAAEPELDAADKFLKDHLERTRRCQQPDGDALVPSGEIMRSVSAHSEALRRPGTLPSADLCPRLPDLGDSIFGFTLLRELGRGAFARVFLAEEGNLGGRPVVVKVSRIEGTEPQTLAQLQHTHIVPVNSVHEDAGDGLRALCMPYFGGASLSQVLDTLRASTAYPTRGEELVRALDASGKEGQGDREIGRQGDKETGGQRANETTAAAAASPCLPVSLSPCALVPELTNTPRATLSKLTYIQAAAWVVARLAEGLQHAHQRGVLHRDIKPSNILLGSDGQPLLLDFNLAQREAGEQDPAGLGGTVAYMSPEHLRALAGRDQALARLVDRRSDVYALGMVLYEMLAGRRPFDQHASYAPLPVLIEAMALERGRGSPSLRAVRPDAPWSLESIVHRCLAPDPDCRYRQAEELAEDLRRFLDDRPLCHAPELSRVEKMRKWGRRHPRLTSSGTVFAAALVLLAASGVALVAVQSSLSETRSRLEASHAQDRQRLFVKGAERSLFLLNTTHDLEDHLRQGTAVCEETLALYGVLGRPDWQTHPDWQRLESEDQRGLAGDVRELLLLLAGARVRLAPHDRQALETALALLDRAEAIEGLEPCRALGEDRAAYLTELGDRKAAGVALAAAQRLKPQTARDYYLLAMTSARDRKYADAIASLDAALRLNPRHYWASMQRGLCHTAQNEHALAAADFGTCVGLQPDFAWGYFNRAFALAQCGKRAEAVADYGTALRLDPDLHAAYLNRGTLRLEAGDAQAALDDFHQALARGRDDPALHVGRGVALERLRRHAEADAAFATAWARAADSPRDLRRRLRWVYGFAVAVRLPAEARTAFNEVLAAEPNHPQALYGLAMLLDGQRKWAEALPYYDRAVAAAPQFTEARRFRAVLLARLGQYATASREIQLCLDRDDGAGATYYAAACIAALTVCDDGREADRAILLLKRALAKGYGLDKTATDPDLDGIRSHVDFPK